MSGELVRGDAHQHRILDSSAQQLGIAWSALFAEAEFSVQRQRGEVAAVDADLTLAIAVLLEHEREQDADGVGGVAAAAMLGPNPEAVAEPAGGRVGLDPDRPNQCSAVQRLDRQVEVITGTGRTPSMRRPVPVATDVWIKDAGSVPVEPGQAAMVRGADLA